MRHTFPKQERKVALTDIFFMGLMPKDGEQIKLNGAFHTNLSIIQFVVALVAEAELGALFHNCLMEMIF